MGLIVDWNFLYMSFDLIIWFNKVEVPFWPILALVYKFNETCFTGSVPNCRNFKALTTKLSSLVEEVVADYWMHFSLHYLLPPDPHLICTSYQLKTLIHLILIFNIASHSTSKYLLKNFTGNSFQIWLH